MNNITYPSHHIMLSYQWNHQQIVTDIYNHLKEAQNWPVWMDKHGGMGESLSSSMAEGVQNCCVFVCFITPEYQESINCKKEITYALQLRKPVIPCLLGCAQDKSWIPSDWLGLSISDLLYLNFTDINVKNFSTKCQELIEKIHGIVGTSAPSSDLDEEES